MESNVPPSDSPPPAPASALPPPLQPPPIIPPAGASQPRRQGRGWKIAVVIFLVLFALSFLSNLRHFALGVLRGKGGTPHLSKARLEEVTIAWAEKQASDNKIAVIPVEGIIFSE